MRRRKGGKKTAYLDIYAVAYLDTIWDKEAARELEIVQQESLCGQGFFDTLRD
jgi:hypothetical protein